MTGRRVARDRELSAIEPDTLPAVLRNPLQFGCPIGRGREEPVGGDAAEGICRTKKHSLEVMVIDQDDNPRDETGVGEGCSLQGRSRPLGKDVGV